MERSLSYINVSVIIILHLLFMAFIDLFLFPRQHHALLGRRPRGVEPGVALELRGGALEPSGVHVEQVVGRKGLPVVEQGLPGARGVDQVKLERVLVVSRLCQSPIANALSALARQVPQREPPPVAALSRSGASLSSGGRSCIVLCHTITGA